VVVVVVSTVGASVDVVVAMAGSSVGVVTADPLPDADPIPDELLPESDRDEELLLELVDTALDEPTESISTDFGEPVVASEEPTPDVKEDILVLESSAVLELLLPLLDDEFELVLLPVLLMLLPAGSSLELLSGPLSDIGPLLELLSDEEPTEPRSWGRSPSAPMDCSICLPFVPCCCCCCCCCCCVVGFRFPGTCAASSRSSICEECSSKICPTRWPCALVCVRIDDATACALACAPATVWPVFATALAVATARGTSTQSIPPGPAPPPGVSRDGHGSSGVEPQTGMSCLPPRPAPSCIDCSSAATSFEPLAPAASSPPLSPPSLAVPPGIFRPPSVTLPVPGRTFALNEGGSLGEFPGTANGASEEGAAHMKVWGWNVVQGETGGKSGGRM